MSAHGATLYELNDKERVGERENESVRARLRFEIETIDALDTGQR